MEMEKNYDFLAYYANKNETRRDQNFIFFLSLLMLRPTNVFLVAQNMIFMSSSRFFIVPTEEDCSA